MPCNKTEKSERVAMRSAWVLAVVFGLSMISFPENAQAEDQLVLTVRPELLIKNQGETFDHQQRNPFAWPGKKKQEEDSGADLKLVEELGRYKIDAILWNKTKPQAIINGTLLAEHEKIGDATIAEIQRNSIIIENNGLRQTLEFSKNDIDLGQ